MTVLPVPRFLTITCDNVQYMAFGTKKIDVGFPLLGFRTEVIFLIGDFFSEILNFLELLTFVPVN